ncbi:hypothetical protein Hanom_Chr04g00363531 [Helianthus anomalus]
MAVANFSVTVSYAPRGALPYEFSAIPTNLQTVTVVTGIVFVTHEPEKCHVYGSHAKLERLEVETKILPVAVEDLIIVEHKTAN